MMPYFWQLAINLKLKIGYVDSYAKIFLILYPLFENSTTPIAIVRMHVHVLFWSLRNICRTSTHH